MKAITSILACIGITVSLLGGTVNATSTNVAPKQAPSPLACSGTLVWTNPDINLLMSPSRYQSRTLMHSYKNVPGDNDSSRMTYDTGVTVKSGTYSGVIRTWDGYDGRYQTSPKQTNENLQAVFKVGNNTVYATEFTKDLADYTDRDSAQIDTSIKQFTLTQDAKLSFKHIGGANWGSVVPTAICLNQVPVCEYNDDILSTDPNCKPVCQYNDELFADDSNCKPVCEHNDDIFADDPNCQPVCEYNDDILANDPKCKPEVCEHNPDLNANDPNCKPEVCEYNDDILSTDPNCKPVCQYNDELFADDSNCKPVCTYNSDLFADDPNCQKPCEPGKDSDCTEVPPVKEITDTGAAGVIALTTAVSTAAAGAHNIFRRFRG